MTEHTTEIAAGRHLSLRYLLTRWFIVTPILRWNDAFFWLLSLILLISIGIANRSGMLDNENYLNYFQQTDLNWFLNLFSTKDNISLFLVYLLKSYYGEHGPLL